MAQARLSNCFKFNEFLWKIFGLWPGRSTSKYYKYYSVFYLLFTLIIYNILLTLNLVYAPKKMDLLIREMIFFFTEISITFKVLMILFKRKHILATFNLLDCELFEGDNDIVKQIIENSVKKYITGFKFYFIFSNVTYFFYFIAPILLFIIFGQSLELPTCKYYFLSDELRDKYFPIWLIYQSFGIYGHMVYNVSIDSFVAGFILMCITQLKVINHKMTNLKLESWESKKTVEVQEKLMMSKLNRCLKHYDVVLELHSIIQEIISVTMFVLFGMEAIMICVLLYGFTIPSANETIIAMVCYLCGITSQIFVPGWLGTELSNENKELVFAAYNSDWIPRSVKFKRSLRIFVERANSRMELTGLQMFPLTLATFTSIIKMAYSLLALLRNVQEP